MNSIEWLTVDDIIALHDEQIKETGGGAGILNRGALESTVNRPKQLAHYQPESTICDLAAAYGHGLAKNHCFLDGNKRTALDAMFVFLDLNGYELTASEPEAVEIMVSLAQNFISQEELAAWLTEKTCCTADLIQSNMTSGTCE